MLSVVTLIDHPESCLLTVSLYQQYFFVCVGGPHLSSCTYGGIHSEKEKAEKVYYVSGNS